MTAAFTECILDFFSNSGMEERKRLPVEHDLAQQLATGRNMVREALNSFPARGQGEIGKRSGGYLIPKKTPLRWHSQRVDTGPELLVKEVCAVHSPAALAERTGKVRASTVTGIRSLWRQTA